MKVTLVRHAKSEAKIGNKTSYPDSIKLTESGHRQARVLAERITSALELIIVTNHSRTYQTSKPLINKFPIVQVEIWPLQEFTFLSPPLFENTSPEERLPSVREYWLKCDPDYIHGPGAESFNQFSIRVRTSLLKLSSLNHNNVFVFTHGHVIRLIRQFLSVKHDNDQWTMLYYRDSILSLPIANCEKFGIDLSRLTP